MKVNTSMLPSVPKSDGVTIRLETDYPFKNKMHYFIEADRNSDFIIRILCLVGNLDVNGEKAEVKRVWVTVCSGDK